MPNRKQTPKKTAPENTDKPKETRDQKLARLAPKRVNIALHRIRLIGNLALYRPSDAQVDKICQALAEASMAVEARLRGTRKDSAAFTL